MHYNQAIELQTKFAFLQNKVRVKKLLKSYIVTFPIKDNYVAQKIVLILELQANHVEVCTTGVFFNVW